MHGIPSLLNLFFFLFGVGGELFLGRRLPFVLHPSLIHSKVDAKPAKHSEPIISMPRIQSPRMKDSNCVVNGMSPSLPVRSSFLCYLNIKPFAELSQTL